MLNLFTFVIPVIEFLAYICICCFFAYRQRGYDLKNINSSGTCFVITIAFFMLVPVLDVIDHFCSVNGIALFFLRLMLNVLAIIYLQTFLYKVAMTMTTEELAKKINFFEANKKNIIYFNTFILIAVPVVISCIEGYQTTYRYYWVLALTYAASTAYISCLWVNTKIKSLHWVFFTAFNAIYWWLCWRIGVNYYHHGDKSILPFVVIAKILRITPLFFVGEGRFSDSCVYEVEEK